ncbi:Uncharacterized ABC transporter ATP-binding protein YfmR [Chlamydiales bacterium SCGC AG-110-P3]|nr:Uncharacterized ABC transporter ATP-binding protein YfmR [Chlamydiales bacterium SCGC AG-110-P3]
MTYISCRDLSKSYGTNQLFTGVNLSVMRGDRIGLIGPNGSGKSTLLQIVAGLEQANSGEVIHQRGLRIAYVPQVSSFSDHSVKEEVLSALSSDNHLDDHERETRAFIALGKVGFEDFEQRCGALSGGWRKRLEIARCMAMDPDVLLLDEPTNHLDLEGILWLEQFLRREVATFVLISHDRTFLESVTSRVMELNPRYPGCTFGVDGSYSIFLEKRADYVSGQEKQKVALASKVRREVEWLRKTPQARTTKSRSRIQEAHALQGDLKDLQTRTREKRADVSFVGTARQTRKLLVGHNLSMAYDGRKLFTGVNVTLSPGTRLGIVGVNGTGKSTLLKLLGGELELQEGTLKRADGVQIVHFDQHREQLPLDTPLRYALCEDGETVHHQGRAIHVSGWARRFLFPPERLDQQIGKLSGGERARILIARLILRPADILLLDEPTNDLDIETLEILEESLLEFPGAVVLITHDRLMLDQVATEVIGLGTDTDDRHFADYAQWEVHRERWEKRDLKPPQAPKTAKPSLSSKKLSYHEQRELAGMEEAIMSTEEELERHRTEVEDPDTAADGQRMKAACERMGETQTRLDALYARWQELEAGQ